MERVSAMHFNSSQISSDCKIGRRRWPLHASSSPKTLNLLHNNQAPAVIQEIEPREHSSYKELLTLTMAVRGGVQVGLTAA